jgi:hypothetical protein
MVDCSLVDNDETQIQVIVEARMNKQNRHPKSFVTQFYYFFEGFTIVVPWFMSQVAAGFSIRYGMQYALSTGSSMTKCNKINQYMDSPDSTIFAHRGNRTIRKPY